MKIVFPSREFDDAVVAVCHDLGSDEQMRALNELLRQDPAARDEYILRVELHSRLASQRELFVPATGQDPETGAENPAFPGRTHSSAPPARDTKRKLAWAVGIAAGLALLVAAGWRLQRTGSASQAGASSVAVSNDDWKPSAANLPGEEYPRINSERRVQFRIKAPHAKNVSVNIGRPLTVERSEGGIWTITTAPLGIGFHFYRVNIDGASVADPATQIFRGGGGDWQSSGIEVPTGEDFHERKDVPHGEIREHRYFSPATDAWRRAFVYTPPGYGEDASARYPVLYLLHGGGEDETCWPAQGRVSQILDNLIAEQKAAPMLVVMDRGAARRPGEPAPSFPPADENRAFATLDDVFMHELIPAIDQTYRTKPEREHRALAGLSLGAAQAFAIGFRHLDRFAALGSFSGMMGAGFSGRPFDSRTAHGGAMADADSFNRQMRVLFLSVGADEPDWILNGVDQYRQALEVAGINHQFYQSADTEHEWHTWRRSLREFASLLFKE